MINDIDGVKNSCVVGIFEEEKGNDLIFAFVIKDPSKAKLTEDEIADYVHSKVIDAKKFRGGVHFVDSFPLTPTGKIKRADVRVLARKYYDKKNGLIQ